MLNFTVRCYILAALCSVTIENNVVEYSGSAKYISVSCYLQTNHLLLTLSF